SPPALDGLAASPAGSGRDGEDVRPDGAQGGAPPRDRAGGDGASGPRREGELRAGAAVLAVPPAGHQRHGGPSPHEPRALAVLRNRPRSPVENRGGLLDAR